MRGFKVASISVLVTLLPVQAQASDSAKSPSKMSSSEIAEYNKGLDSSDPAYIKCQRIAETGSLIGKKRVCRTNAQWAAASESANRETRDMVEGMARSGGSSGN
ncbi:MAG TPA: hypothetical protein VJM09_05995 [Sphingobium sp.]|nr:hypothetical protein [Sphingobium sp.]